MDLNQGKVLFASFDEASRVSAQMRKNKGERFQPYRVDGGWAIGGKHLKKISPVKRAKSFGELRDLYEVLKESDQDLSIDSYLSDIQDELMNKSSLPQGEDGKWVLKSFYMKKGYEFSDMNNSNDYLTINVSNGIEDKELRMGGKFSRHFPLLLKVADSLLDEPIIWHTWNAANAPGKWADSVWFYRIELNGD